MNLAKSHTAFAAIVGGVLWLALNVALSGAWDRGDAFPTYEFLNALRPLPLALFAVAVYGLSQQTRAVGRRALVITLAGFFLLAAGAALEFWIGGGVRDGDVDTLSLAGWLIYLVGYLVLSIGLISFGIAFRQTPSLVRLMPLALGIVWAIWFPSVMLSNIAPNNLADLSQMLFALIWVGLGILLLTPTPLRTNRQSQ